MEYAAARAAENGVVIHTSLGYMEDVIRHCPPPFDVVFNRVCWYYCVNDRRFAQLIVSLLRPGGLGYVKTNIEDFTVKTAGKARVYYWLNAHLGCKIGHSFPPKGRVAACLAQQNVSMCEVSWRIPGFEEVFFTRA
jgi:SAM-dependent methyltransferase